jgi:hypothetical protein
MINCPLCGRTRIRGARIYGSDSPEVLIGLFPMRCRDCLCRFFKWMPLVLISELIDVSIDWISAGLHRTKKA